MGGEEFQFSNAPTCRLTIVRNGNVMFPSGNIGFPLGHNWAWCHNMMFCEILPVMSQHTWNPTRDLLSYFFFYSSLPETCCYSTSFQTRFYDVGFSFFFSCSFFQNAWFHKSCSRPCRTGMSKVQLGGHLWPSGGFCVASINLLWRLIM